MPTIWRSTVYSSPDSHMAEYLCLEGRTKAEALALLQRMAAEPSGVGGYAKRALSGDFRCTLVKLGKDQRVAYAAQDGYWRVSGKKAGKLLCAGIYSPEFQA